MMDDCPSIETLRFLTEGTLEDSECVRLTKHLDGCLKCRQRLDELTASHLTHIDTEILSLLDSNLQEEPKIADLVQAVRTHQPKRFLSSFPSEEIHFLDPSTQKDALGRFGEYEVLELIANGPMGIVLKAFEPLLKRIVAIKILAPRLVQDDRARERFLREARAMAAVRHENIIEIYSVSTEKGLPYLVMPYIQGRNLQVYLKENTQLSPPEILQVGLQLAKGLEAAHQKNLIHRDIKPSNILLGENLNKLVITDFGLARSEEDLSLTRIGEIAGTPQFMSPEQAEAKPVDHRTDLFSLGSVLYYLATGNPPFEADSILTVLRKVVEEEVKDLRDQRFDIPQPVIAIIEKLLQKNPKDRYESAQEVVLALETYLAEEEKSVVRKSVVEDLQVDVSAHRKFIFLKKLFGISISVICVLGIIFFMTDRNGMTVIYNSILCEITGNPFYIRGQIGTYSSLQDVVDQAENGDRIEVRSNTLLEIDPTIIQGKFLTIRSAKNYAPKWQSLRCLATYFEDLLSSRLGGN